MSEIRKYVRDRQGRPVGLLVAAKVNDEVRFGWSKCNRKDRWSPQIAYRIAKGRVDAGRSADGLHALPNSMEEAASYFIKRAERYFGTR